MKYLLNIERLDDIVNEFVNDIENVSFRLKIEKTPYLKKQYIFTYENDKAYLNCHISKGKVTFDIQGKDGQALKICEQCKDYLIENAQIPMPERKCLKIKEVEEKDWDTFIEELQKEENYDVVKVENNNATALVARYKVTDQYGATLHLQYFTNGTVFAQGAVSTLFVAFQTFLLAYLSPAPDLVTDIFLSIKSIEEDIFSNDLSCYFHHPEYIEGSVIETLVRTSFIIANSGCVLPDYGAMTYGAFRALEALLYKRLRVDLPTLSQFSCFNTDPTTHDRTLSVPVFDAKPMLKAAILHAYDFYCENRHATFHVDPIIETSRVLEKDEAIGLIKDALDHMNNICDNW